MIPTALEDVTLPRRIILILIPISLCTFLSNGMSHLFLHLTNLLHLPPPAVMMRRVRPFLFMLVLLGLTGQRFYSKHQHQQQSCEWQDDHVGLFDLVVQIIHSTLRPLQEFPQLELFLNDVLGLILLQALVIHPLQALRRTSPTESTQGFLQSVFAFAKEYIPAVKTQLAKEEASMEHSLSTTLKNPNHVKCHMLPQTGQHPQDLLQNLQIQVKKENQSWQEGKVSGTVYHGQQDHTTFLAKVYEAYLWSNPLHADLWPGLNQMEAEVWAMVASLFDGTYHQTQYQQQHLEQLDNKGTNQTSTQQKQKPKPKPPKVVPEIVGSVTSGGTESILLAIRAHLHYYTHKHSIRHPELIACVTAHAAVHKACDMFGIRLVLVPCATVKTTAGGGDGCTYQMDIKAAHRAISSDTIMLYASAPSFPQGTVDDITKLSALAVRYGIGLHVDACLGGFILPFLHKNTDEHGDVEMEVPEFDFRLEGVTSMSVDTHKYGYAPKGTSVVLYRHKHLRRAQYFTYSKWTGGLYATPTFAGSRPGALIAGAWATLQTIGYDGYQKHAWEIVETARRIGKGVEAIDGFYVLGGKIQAMIVCIGTTTPSTAKNKGEKRGSPPLNIYAIADEMKHRKWSLNTLQHPPCIHLCVTLQTIPRVGEFLHDLQESVKAVTESQGGGGGKEEGGSAAIYGMAGSMPAGPVEELLKCYTDVLLTP